VKFYEGQKDFSKIFLKSKKDADTSAAMRCAHTLKGNAGNIGAKGVQQAAAELEEACKNKANATQTQELLARVVLELEPVIASLATMIESSISRAKQSTAINPEEFQKKLHLLKSLLEESDGDALDCLTEVLEQAQSGPMAFQLKQVMRDIENYDFDQALENLKLVQL
jgi:HPt (histidine-containing phosphotransfer) domain-containing protein